MKIKQGVETNHTMNEVKIDKPDDTIREWKSHTGVYE